MCCDPDSRYDCLQALAHPWYAAVRDPRATVAPRRISGDTALAKDIHGSVAVHLRRSLAKKNWRKVRGGREGRREVDVLLPQAYNAAAAIRQLQMLRLTSSAARKMKAAAAAAAATTP